MNVCLTEGVIRGSGAFPLSTEALADFRKSLRSKQAALKMPRGLPRGDSLADLENDGGGEENAFIEQEIAIWYSRKVII